MNNDTSLSKPLKLTASIVESCKIEIPDGQLFYLPDWIASTQAAALYAELANGLSWSQDRVFVYGKWHQIPRLQAWYGDDEAAYQYSGKMLRPLKWTNGLSQLREQVQHIGIPVNSVLANWYRDGMDKMGWHSDNERELGAQPTIASLSFGAPRSFHLRHKSTGQRINLELASGSLLVMAGTMQQHWQHALPQRKRVKQGRINLTFRHVQQSA